MIYAAVICTFLLAHPKPVLEGSQEDCRFIFLQGLVSLYFPTSLLAANRFIYPFPFAGEMVMLTYCSALFLIVRGSMHHTKMVYIIMSS